MTFFVQVDAASLRNKVFNWAWAITLMDLSNETIKVIASGPKTLRAVHNGPSESL